MRCTAPDKCKTLYFAQIKKINSYNTLILIKDLGLLGFLRYPKYLEHGWHVEDTLLIFVEWKNLGIAILK